MHVEPLTISKISFLHWERQTIIVFSVREKIEGFKWRNVSPRSSFSKLSRLLTFLLNGICLFYDATNDSTHRHGYNDPRCADNFFSLAFSLVGARSIAKVHDESLRLRYLGNGTMSSAYLSYHQHRERWWRTRKGVSFLGSQYFGAKFQGQVIPSWPSAPDY